MVNEIGEASGYIIMRHELWSDERRRGVTLDGAYINIFTYKIHTGVRFILQCACQNGFWSPTAHSPVNRRFVFVGCQRMRSQIFGVISRLTPFSSERRSSHKRRPLGKIIPNVGVKQ